MHYSGGCTELISLMCGFPTFFTCVPSKLRKCACHKGWGDACEFSFLFYTIWIIFLVPIDGDISRISQREKQKLLIKLEKSEKNLTFYTRIVFFPAYLCL